MTVATSKTNNYNSILIHSYDGKSFYNSAELSKRRLLAFFIGIEVIRKVYGRETEWIRSANVCGPRKLKVYGLPT